MNYLQTFKEKHPTYWKEWYIANKDNVLAKTKAYKKTLLGRAVNLIQNYKRMDKERGFDKSIDFDYKWIVENIFSKSCPYCGRSGWQIMGCNRIDNSKPHTKDNVEPCCDICNKRLGSQITKDLQSKLLYQYTLDGELVKIWNSTNECGRNGFNQGHIVECCNGKRKTHKGYKWSYEPL